MANHPAIQPSFESAPLEICPPVWGRRFESDLLQATRSDRFFVELCPKQPYRVRYQPDCHILGFALESQTGYDAFASDRITPYRAPAKTFAFTPAGCETFSESSQGGAYLIFAVSPEFLERYAEDIAAHQPLNLRRLSHLRNSEVTAIGRAAQRFIQMNPSGGRLYFESLAGQFATHIILALLSKPEIPAQSNQLSALALNQLVEFVEANLSEDLSLSTLAELAGMTVPQFVRSFKAKVGRSPHAWVLTSRIDRAKSLLENTDEAIAQIAFDCGFSSQSHMTTLFSKHIGTTPKQYRKMVC